MVLSFDMPRFNIELDTGTNQEKRWFSITAALVVELPPQDGGYGLLPVVFIRQRKLLDQLVNIIFGQFARLLTVFGDELSVETGNLSLLIGDHSDT